MNKKAFKAWVSKLGGTVVAEVDLNSNNVWGFGGFSGTRTQFDIDGVVVFLDAGKLCYRHMPPDNEIHVHIGSLYNKPFILELFMKLFSEGARNHDEFVQRFKLSLCKDSKPSEDQTVSSSSSTPTRSSRKTRGKARRPS